MLSWQLGCDLEQDSCGMPWKATSDTSISHDLDVSVSTKFTKIYFTKFMRPFIKGKGAQQICFKIKHNLDVSDTDWILVQKILFFHLGLSRRFFVKPHLSVSTCFDLGWMGNSRWGNYSGSTWFGLRGLSRTGKSYGDSNNENRLSREKQDSQTVKAWTWS